MLALSYDSSARSYHMNPAAHIQLHLQTYNPCLSRCHSILLMVVFARVCSTWSCYFVHYDLLGSTEINLFKLVNVWGNNFNLMIRRRQEAGYGFEAC